MQDESRTFVIAEYQPFNHRAHVVGIRLDPPSVRVLLLHNYSTKHKGIFVLMYTNSCKILVIRKTGVQLVDVFG